MENSLCDIIMPVWNQLLHTKKCIESIQKNTELPHRLIIIDNASDDDTRKYLEELARRYENITLIRNEENLGFIKAVNEGLKKSNAKFACLMNNDTIPAAGWLKRLIDLAESKSDIGLVNPQSESPGRLSVDEYSRLLARKRGQYIETNQCLGFCMLIKRELIEKIGILDDVFGMGGFDDTDFSMRAHKAGYKCVSACDAYVYHKWHTSFKKAGNREELVRRNEKIFFNRWGKFLRIAYPILGGSNENFISDMYTAIGLAREWNWIHAWVLADGNKRKILQTLSLPKHQNLRLFYLYKSKVLFLITILFKLIERANKKKKAFDIVLVSNKTLFKILSRFKKFFRTPILYMDINQSPVDPKNEHSWTTRANFIADFIRKEHK